MDEMFHESVDGGTATPYLVDLLQQKKITPGKVLEIGCANGANAVYLANAGFTVTGVDISVTAIQYARENAQAAGVNASFLAADASDLGFIDDKFDLVIDWGAYHAITPDRREPYLWGIKNHTEPGAKFILRVYSSRDPESQSTGPTVGRKRYYFSEADIAKAFGQYFKILERTEGDIQLGPMTGFFDHYLMERIAES